MRIFVGADHRGFKLKQDLVAFLKTLGHEVIDVGASVYDSDDDYVDYARKACESLEEGDRGILLCGSGHGVDIVANKHKGIRGILGFNLEVVVQGREHEDANVLSIPAEWVEKEEVFEMAKTFMETSFSGKENYKRRIEKIGSL
ncbi:RpiB/LacA/LacB family sugar-phosphate isomerase [Patescibacteria group bacterium]